MLTVLAIIGALSISFALVALAELAEAKWLRDHPEEPEPLTSRPRLGIVFFTEDERQAIDQLYPWVKR